MSSFPWPPVLCLLVSSLSYFQTLACPWLLPLPFSPKPESELLLQGHLAWEELRLEPRPLGPSLPHSGQQAGPVPCVSHAPGLWPPFRLCGLNLERGAFVRKRGSPGSSRGLKLYPSAFSALRAW